MGITGLLPLLDKSSKRTNIGEFAGSTVAIDSYCWLHKGAFSCADKLIMGETTDKHVIYCMRYIDMLRRYNIKPILVFDGQNLPAKEPTEIKRHKAREINRRKAVELIQMGQVTEGRNLLRRSINITHKIALQLIKHCQSENIDCIVAPYEADAQLAYLNISGIADVVITEDSDLTLFGCKKIFFKMDVLGNGILIEQDKLHLAMNMPPVEFNMDKFRHICILSGCDYLPSLPGIGLKKAQKFITRNTDHNIHKALTRMGSILNMKSLIVTEEYRNGFILADITYKHQLVFCPLQKKQVRLNPPAADVTKEQLRYAGEELDEDLALQFAYGNCDTSTLKRLHDFNPDKLFERQRKQNMGANRTAMNHNSIWSNQYEIKTKNSTSSFEDRTSFLITTKEKLVPQRNSLKDSFVLSKLHNSSIMQCDKFPEYETLNENAILDMYNQNSNLQHAIASPEKCSAQPLDAENNLSPELLKRKNPFVKRSSNITTSPSILSNENYRKRSRNLMRIRRTIIDENIIIESKYFSQTNNEKSNIVMSENNIENIIPTPENDTTFLENRNYNIIPEISTNIYDNDANKKQLETPITDFVEKSDSINHIDETNNSTNRNNYLDNSYEDIFEKSYLDSSKNEISSGQCATIDINYSPNKTIISSPNAERITNSTNHENTNNLRDYSPEWINITNYAVAHKKLKNNTEKNSAKLKSGVNSVIKQIRQNKRKLSDSTQQRLLSMYGFRKRSTIK